jgi:hypothetical protein
LGPEEGREREEGGAGREQEKSRKRFIMDPEPKKASKQTPLL